MFRRQQEEKWVARVQDLRRKWMQAQEYASLLEVEDRDNPDSGYQHRQALKLETLALCKYSKAVGILGHLIMMGQLPEGVQDIE